MNIENLLKEIDVEKEKMVSEIELNNKQLNDKFYEKDSMLLSPLLIVAIGIAFYTAISKTYGIGLVIMSLACAIFPILPYILSCFATKNLSFSYHFKSVFKDEKLRKNLTAEQKRIVSKHQINNNFLKKIALNMEKYEFAEFLRRCDGEVTLSKLIYFMNEFPKDSKKCQKIENLTTVIYKENELTHNFLKGENNEYKRNI